MTNWSNQGRSWPGGGVPGVRTPPASFKFTFSNDPNPMSFLLGGRGIGRGMGMGIGHNMVTICVDLILRLVFIVVHNCDPWIYFTITLIVIAAQERSSKHLALYFALTWLWIRKLIFFHWSHILIRRNNLMRINHAIVAPPWESVLSRLLPFGVYTPRPGKHSLAE